MITLLRELYGRYFGRPRYNVLVVGLDGQGKTKLLNACKKLRGGENVECDDSKIIPTTGLNSTLIGQSQSPRYAEVDELVDAEQSKLRLWDLGGRRDLQKIWEHYYAASHAVLFVVRVKTLPERELEILSCFDKLMKEENLKDIPVMIILNEDSRIPLPPTKDFEASLQRMLSDRPHAFRTIKLPNHSELEGCVDWLQAELLRISNTLGVI